MRYRRSLRSALYFADVSVMPLLPLERFVVLMVVVSSECFAAVVVFAFLVDTLPSKSSLLC
jgi:hypothetical protein